MEIKKYKLRDNSILDIDIDRITQDCLIWKNDKECIARDNYKDIIKDKVEKILFDRCVVFNIDESTICSIEDDVKCKVLNYIGE